MRWGWFILRREIGHRVVCMWLRGHDFEWRELCEPGVDGRVYSARCRRCHRLFPKVLSFHFTTNRVHDEGQLAKKQAELERRMRRAKDMPQGAYEAMFR